MLGTDAIRRKLNALGVEINEFVPQSATEDEWKAFQSISNREELETDPDDPPTTLDDLKKNLLNQPPFVQFKGWLCSRGNIPIAYFWTGMMLTDENQHLLQFNLYVLPEERGKGLGSLLLIWIADEARIHNRRLLLTGTSSAIPAGDIFMEHLGGEMALSTDVSQLLIEKLDRDLLMQWLTRARERGDGLILEHWHGAYPEDEIEAVAEMMSVMNTAPRDNLDVEDFNVTPERIREMEKVFAARNMQRWTYFVRDPATNRLAGYTELHWRASKPERLGQGATAVVPEYRNRGIGRWVKAAALLGVLEEHPEVKYVRTDNATSNAAMLKINHEMGFCLYKIFRNWQVDRCKVEEYLAKK